MGEPLTAEQDSALERLKALLPKLSPEKRAQVETKLRQYGKLPRMGMGDLRMMESRAGNPELAPERAEQVSAANRKAYVQKSKQRRQERELDAQLAASDLFFPPEPEINRGQNYVSPPPGARRAPESKIEKELIGHAFERDQGSIDPSTGQHPFKHSRTSRVAALGAIPLAIAARGLDKGITLGFMGNALRAAGAGEGQNMVEDIAGAHPTATDTIAIASSFFPQSAGNKIAGAISEALPVAAGNPVIRAALSTARTGLAGGGVGLTQGVSDTIERMQKGESFHDASASIPEGALTGGVSAMALHPLFAGAQRIGARSAENLREKPGMEDLVNLERTGLSTQFGIPGVRQSVQSEAPGFVQRLLAERPIPPAEGNAIREAQIQQRGSGVPAKEITGRDAATAALDALGAEQGRVGALNKAENAVLKHATAGQTVSTEPFVKRIIDLIANKTYESGDPLIANEDQLAQLKRFMRQAVSARYAAPGEQGVPLAVAQRMGIEVEGLPEAEDAIGRAKTLHAPPAGAAAPELDLKPRKPATPPKGYTKSAYGADLAEFSQHHADVVMNALKSGPQNEGALLAEIDPIYHDSFRRGVRDLEEAGYVARGADGTLQLTDAGRDVNWPAPRTPLPEQQSWRPPPREAAADSEQSVAEMSLRQIQAKFGVGYAEAARLKKAAVAARGQSAPRSDKAVIMSAFSGDSGGSEGGMTLPPADENMSFTGVSSARGAGAPPPDAAPRFIVIEPKQLSSSDLEEGVRALSFKSKEHQNVRQGGQGENANVLAAVLRDMRAGFDAKGAVRAPEATKGDKVLAADSYEAAKEQQHVRLSKLENQLKAFGLPERIDNIDPQDVQQLRTVMNRIQSSNHELEQVAPQDPELQRKLRVAAAHAAYDRLVGKNGQPHGIVGEGGMRGYVGLGQGVRLSFDPLMRGIGAFSHSPEARTAVTSARAGRVGGTGVPAELLRRYLDSIGLGEEQP